jgi:electron-transferring-flavoprotein dehydrogenase
MILFGENKHVTIPNLFLPKSVHNHGNFIISLGDLCKWMGEQAESLGVDILPGIAGDRVRFNDDGSVGGVITGDFGIAKDSTKKSTYSQGIEIRAK